MTFSRMVLTVVQSIDFDKVYNDEYFSDADPVCAQLVVWGRSCFAVYVGVYMGVLVIKIYG